MSYVHVVVVVAAAAADDDDDALRAESAVSLRQCYDVQQVLLPR